MAQNTEWEIIFIPSFVHWRSGKRLYAKDYGLKGFPIRVRRRRKKKK